MASYGAFALVLHVHSPLAFYAHHSPGADEYLCRITAEVLVPLASRLTRMVASGVTPNITIGFTPTVAERLASPDFSRIFLQYIDERIAAAFRDVRTFSGEQIEVFGSTGDTITNPNPLNGHMRFLAQNHVEFYQAIKDAFVNDFEGSVIAPFRQLREDGQIELMTSAASYAYLPKLNDSAVDTQIRLALQIHEQIFGHKPTSFWLPGGGYTPKIAQVLAAHGIKAFVAETHLLKGGLPVGLAAGETRGLSRDVKPLVTTSDPIANPVQQIADFQPHIVKDAPEIAVFQQDPATFMQIWGGVTGYPGDFDYRAGDRRFGQSSLHYWRVTGPSVSPDARDVYHPDWAGFKTDQHAEHFGHMVSDLLRNHRDATGKTGLITVGFEISMLANYWFEGVDWLGKMLYMMGTSPDVKLTTLSTYLNANPPTEPAVDVYEGSSGLGGKHFMWRNGANRWTWHEIDHVLGQMVNAANTYPDANPNTAAVLNQMYRELLILSSSDWQILLLRSQSSEGRSSVAAQFSEHLIRFQQLAKSLEEGTPAVELALTYADRLDVLKIIDYRILAGQIVS